MLGMLQIRSTHDYDKVLHALQSWNVRITSFSFEFSFKCMAPFTVAVKRN